MKEAAIIIKMIAMFKMLAVTCGILILATVALLLIVVFAIIVVSFVKEMMIKNGHPTSYNNIRRLQ